MNLSVCDEPWFGLNFIWDTQSAWGKPGETWTLLSAVWYVFSGRGRITWVDRYVRWNRTWLTVLDTNPRSGHSSGSSRSHRGFIQATRHLHHQDWEKKVQKSQIKVIKCTIFYRGQIKGGGGGGKAPLKYSQEPWEEPGSAGTHILPEWTKGYLK